jgi:23S rRNA (uridine2552-2'-O)-methyltransferase
MDQENIMELANAVFSFAKQVSADNGSLLIKVWSNGELGKFVDSVKLAYDSCKYVKPDASRADSAELYILAKGFKSV